MTFTPSLSPVFTNLSICYHTLLYLHFPTHPVMGRWMKGQTNGQISGMSGLWMGSLFDEWFCVHLGSQLRPMCTQKLLDGREGTKEWMESLSACVHRRDCEKHVCMPVTALMAIVHRSCSMYCTSVQGPLDGRHLCAWE